MDKIKIIAVVGPTASGKTALAVRLAQHFDGEVISADSMQIYKGMDIATAKPDAEEMMGIPHHLIGFLDPGESFSVSDYCKAAHEIARDIAARGHMPVLCGGTGLYVRSFLENVTFAEDKCDPALRDELNRRYEQEGGETLLRELAAFDPETAAALHPSNSKRIIRAIEIYKTTGVTMSQAVARSHDNPSPYDVTAIGLTFADRSRLYERIDRRVDVMVQSGLIEEAKSFYQKNVGKTAAEAIGYKELRPYLDGEVTLEAALDRLKTETRHYAKRQLTWFRRDEYINWIEVDRCSDVFEAAIKIIGQ